VISPLGEGGHRLISISAISGYYGVVSEIVGALVADNDCLGVVFMRALVAFRRAGILIGGCGVSAAMLVAVPAAVPSAAGATTIIGPSPVGWSAGQQLPVKHPNVGATHSRQVLRQLAGGSGSVSPAVPRAPIAGAWQGVDVASFQEQPTTINWSQVAGAGIKFAAVKATEGDYYTNKYALTDLVNAKAAGLALLAYAYAIPDGDGASSDPVVQANDLIDYLKTGAAGVPPLMLDIEYNPNPDGTGQCYGLSSAAMVSWIAAFAAEVQKRTGQQPVIYTPIGWWSTCTGGSSDFGQLPLWTPYYSATATSPQPTAGWGSWAFWQYSSTGTVTGITGQTDLDQLNPSVVPLLNPGSRRYLTGAPVDLRVRPAAPIPGQALSFSGSGLPPGVAISADGLITGWPVTPGTYSATVTVSDGQSRTATMSFPWTVTMPSGSGPVGPVTLDLGGKCLDDVGNSAADGTAADVWTCTGGPAQSWRYVQDGTLRVHSKCMTVPSGAVSGWKVRLRPCTDGARQQWRLAYPKAVSPSLGGRPTMLRNPGSGMCLAVPGWTTKNGTPVVISACNGNRNQAWTLPAGPVASQLPGKCLDDSGNQTTDGAKVDIWTCDGSAGQAWTVTTAGTVTVRGKCLDVAGSSTVQGTPVDLHTCDSTLGQQWHLIPNGAGAALVNPNSGLCLADPADATADGTQLEIQSCSTADPGQAWRVS
jgi:GH25 family lysozyme M1 (1,4-beta-N-acetylmuramidase)